eukprot:COSAG02_NODE_56452_length_285_cov_1.112903_1_plen_20_part_10
MLAITGLKFPLVALVASGTD